MKIKALILFLPFAAFLIEAASFPLEIKSTCSKMHCMKKATMKTNCRSKKEHDQKSPGKCNNTTDCSVCPLCSTFTFQPQYELSEKYFSLKKNYRLMNAGHVSSYIPPVWKPPNHYFLYSRTI
jgi:hypothetical protein